MEELATTSSSRESQPDPLEMLKTYFGHSNFRPKQWDIIRSIIEDRQDNFVVMATGYGKSLLYQYPSVYLQGLTIVISPLISLMQDQVDSLDSRKISACFLGSAQQEDLIPNIREGMYRIVYITPEFAMGERNGLNLLKDVTDQLNLIAIDEAHCMIQWGRNFRPLYSVLGEIRNDPELSGVPILAVTAVATPRVREDIVATLGLRNAQIWCTGFDRPNLNFHVKMNGSRDNVKELINQNSEGSIIIYCLTKKEADKIADFLQSKAYHSDVDLNQRSLILQDFMANSRGIMVTTVASGMGLNKPDVRLVIHYGVPMEFETYYLQVGQAGRDGKQSQCVMFWHEENFNMHRIIRGLDDQNVTKSEEYKKIEDFHYRQSKTLRDYLTTQGCRRKFILQYFEGINRQCCDNCNSIFEASTSQGSSQTTATETINEADIQLENPSPAKMPRTG